jgi:hypothetical protein
MSYSASHVWLPSGGPSVLICMPNRTNGIPLVSVMRADGRSLLHPKAEASPDGHSFLVVCCMSFWSHGCDTANGRHACHAANGRHTAARGWRQETHRVMTSATHHPPVQHLQCELHQPRDAVGTWSWCEAPTQGEATQHHWYKDPMYGCQLGTTCPIMYAK